MLLVSSDHSFPLRLQHPDIHINLENFSGYVYSGEMPPNDIYAILTTEWEMAPNLATAFISLYGGRIWDIKNALDELYRNKERFSPWKSLTQSYGTVKCCLDWNGEKEGDKQRMREVLTALAETGFVPIADFADPVARVICKKFLGGVVRKSSPVIGLSPSAWDSTTFTNAILPSGQTMRLVIAKVLADRKL